MSPQSVTVMSGWTYNAGRPTVAKRVVSILASLTRVGVGVTSPTGAVVPMRAHPCLESHACVTAFGQLINQLID